MVYIANWGIIWILTTFISHETAILEEEQPYLGDLLTNDLLTGMILQVPFSSGVYHRFLRRVRMTCFLQSCVLYQVCFDVCGGLGGLFRTLIVANNSNQFFS